MQKIALITDSACDLDLNTLKENNINLLPLRIIYSNSDYRDRIDISPQEVYDNLEKEVPKTSLPSAQETEEILNKLEEEGYTHVICISISSGLSGSFNALRLALEDHPKLTSFVYDSKILAYPQGEIVLEVAKLIKEGKSYEEIVREIPEIRKRVIGYFTINTLEYLKRGGRISPAVATIANLIGVLPILTFKDGVVGKQGVTRTVKKAFMSNFEEWNKNIPSFKEDYVLVVLSASDDFEKINKAKEILDIINPGMEIIFRNLSLNVTAHTGPGVIGLGIMKKY